MTSTSADTGASHERDEAILYAKARRIIHIAMGFEWAGRGRGRERIYRADQDPLAWWLGTELIVDLVNQRNAEQ